MIAGRVSPGASRWRPLERRRQPAHTILAVACGAGSAQIEVASDEGFSIGDVVEIRSQVSSESKTITALDPMELDGPLISMYPVGSTVTQQAAAWSQEEAQAGQAAEDAVEDSALAEALNVDVEPPLAAEPPQVAEPLQAAAAEASLDACGAACSSRGRSEGCGHRVLAAADNFFRGRGDACEAAYLWVSEECSQCATCTAAMAGCRSEDFEHLASSGGFDASEIQPSLLPSTSESPLATSRPYDCLSGFFNWKRGWADDKKSWCCVNENRGCPGEPDEPAPRQALMDPESDTSDVQGFKAAPAVATDTSSTTTTSRTNTTTITTMPSTSTTSTAVTTTNTTTITTTSGTTTSTTKTITLTLTNSTTAASTSTSTSTATNTTTRTQTSKTSTRTLTTSTRTSTSTRTPTTSSTRTATTTSTRTVSTTSTRTATTTRTTTSAVTTSAAKLRVASEGASKGHNSLWCVTLITPWSEEKLLLQIAQAQGKSIYQCDGHAVYSNPVVDLGGSETRLLGVDLHCPTVTVHTDGISYEATDNAGVFAKLWEQVISDGDFRKHDWVVKVHPDVVFLPDRLKTILSSNYATEGHLDNGMLFSNCKLGLHGSLEVMSTRALQVYAAGHQRCELGHQEDVYLQACAKELGVSVVNNFDILADKFCYRGDWHQTPDWFKCTDKHAAFHPFKSAEAYLLCLQAAEAR